MLPSILLSCLVAPLFGLANPSETNAEAELLTRTYSLATVLPPKFDDGTLAHVMSAVPLDEKPAEVDASQFDAAARFNEDRLVDLIARIITPTEWELPGRSLSISGTPDSLLLVAAPQETQNEIERFLTYLGSHLNRQVRVRAETYVVGSTALPSISATGDVRATIASLVANGTLLPANDVTLGLISGFPKAWSRTRDRSYLHHHDHEIAQSAAISVPNLATYRIGQRMMLRADLGIDERVVLRFAVSHTQEARPLRVTSTHCAWQVTTQDRVYDNAESAVVESPQLAFSTLVGSLALGSERPSIAYIAPTGSDEMDRHGLLVAFTLESISPAEARFTSGQRSLTILDTAGDFASGMLLPGQPFSNRIDGYLGGDPGEAGMISIAFGLGGASPLAQQLFETARSTANELNDGFDLAEFVHGFVLLAGESVGPTSRALASLLERRAQGSCVGSLDIGARGTAARMPFFSLPFRESPSIGYSGFAETILPTMFADVANASAITNSFAAPLITGRFVRITPEARSPTGKLDIQLVQRLRRGDPIAIEQQVDSNSRIERLDFDSNKLSETLLSGQNSASFVNAFLMLAGAGAANSATPTTATMTIERLASR